MSVFPPPTPEPRILRKQDWAYEAVRERIISNRLKPGERIDQDKLATELGISRIPLRQGLGRLIAEGLVRDNPHHRWVVTELEKGDVRDIYSGREVLEALLAAEATVNATEDDFAAMRAVLDRQALVLSQGSTEGFHQADFAFHDVLYQAARMPKTYAALNGLFTMSERYIRLYQSDVGRAAISLQDHREIFNAVTERDSEKVAQLIRGHISRGRAHLEQSGGGIE